MSEREGVNENKEKLFLLTMTYTVKGNLLSALPTVGSGKVHSLWMFRGTDRTGHCGHKILNISYSIIHSFELATV